MLSNNDLAGELHELAQRAEQTARAVRTNDDLAARQLAAAFVEAGKLTERLLRLQRLLGGDNGKKK